MAQNTSQITYLATNGSSIVTSTGRAVGRTGTQHGYEKWSNRGEQSRSSGDLDANQGVPGEILFSFYDGIAKISINRPHERNAFTPLVRELIDAMTICTEDPRRQGDRPSPRGRQGLLQRRRPGSARRRRLRRHRPGATPQRARPAKDDGSMPKAVMAIGGGHVLHVVCDVYDNARQVGSFNGAALAPPTWRASVGPEEGPRNLVLVRPI